MAVGAESEDGQIQTAESGQLLLEAFDSDSNLTSCGGQGMHVSLRNADAPDECALQPAGETVRVSGGDADVLVEAEELDVGEVDVAAGANWLAAK